MTSQINFDIPPLYDQLIDDQKKLNMSDIWIGYWSTFYETLVSFLSQTGIFLPQLTMAERNALQKPVNGQLIYNLDVSINGPQFWQASSASWKTIQFV